MSPLCRKCGALFTAVYPGQRYHPTCDPDPPGWTSEQLDEWNGRAAQRRARRTEGGSS